MKNSSLLHFYKAVPPRTQLSQLITTPKIETFSLLSPLRESLRCNGVHCNQPIMSAYTCTRADMTRHDLLVAIQPVAHKILSVASLRKPTTTKKVKNNFIHLDDYNDDFDDLHVLNFEPQTTPFSKKRKSFPNSSVTETGQSSNSKNDDLDLSFICEICVEPKSATDTFNIKGCDHAYCTVCMAKYVALKLQENITCIPCPVANCRGLLEPEYCRNMLPQDVFDRWGNALCEAVIHGAQKFYCPYKDCSALLIDDGVEIIKESECPNCRRMFCAQCKVPWHAGIDCAEFQKLNKDERENEDLMLMNLAQEKKWKRCPHCKYYVEKKSGCMYMKCRCGNAFCYNCGALSNSTSHMCPQCNH